MFFVYANHPSAIGETIEAAVKKAHAFSVNIKSWKEMNVVGSFISKGVQEAIKENEVLIADISVLNFNVTYEVGFAIGCGKKILLVKNESIIEGEPTIAEVGIFDSIGYSNYSNSDELYKLIFELKSSFLLKDKPSLNLKVPVYILEQKFKTDYASRVTARIKKARLFFRSFDPNESPRLSVYDAIQQVAESYGVLVSLLSKGTQGVKVHNLRAAFIAGLSQGMNKVTSILQHEEDPVPIDYRDFVNVYYSVDDINTYIANFASLVVEAIQQGTESATTRQKTSLQQLDFGSSAAENEMRMLQAYYLKTDAFNRAIRGEVQLVVGRKGSGKSAIFLQIRDRERSKGKNIVLDLKPEGYKLIKFKEVIGAYLKEGTFNHTITAFWEYILLLEICHKTLESDKVRHINDSELYQPYRNLQDSYAKERYLTEGDFSERMTMLIDSITKKYKNKFGNRTNVNLSVAEITNLLYQSDISILRKDLSEYLKHKEKIWLLFDNIDKGWPSSGLEKEDFIIMRTLIDALRNMQRSMSKNRIELYPIVFLRNDVYEFLVENTSDRQKESKELLDWVDQDLLREVIRLRIISSLGTDSASFEDLWRRICVSHYNGEETSQYIIDRCLMRPRFLINFISQCKGFAVNLQHERIEPEDIEKGLKSYSSDVLTDITYEIRDVLPEAEDVLYNFISAPVELSVDQLNSILSEQVENIDFIVKLIDLLLWHGFLGVRSPNHEIQYIYSLNYNMKLLKGLVNKLGNSIRFVINPSFHPALMIMTNPN